MEGGVRGHEEAEPGHGEGLRGGGARKPLGTGQQQGDDEGRDVHAPEEAGGYAARDVRVEPGDEAGRLFQEVQDEDERRRQERERKAIRLRSSRLIHVSLLHLNPAAGASMYNAEGRGQRKFRVESKERRGRG